MRIRRKAEVDSSDTCWSCESPLTEGAWLVEESEGKGEPIHTAWLGCESCTRFIYEENPLELYVDTGEELIHLRLEDLTRFALAIADVKDIPRDQQRVFLTVNGRRIKLPRWNEEMKPLLIEEL